MGLGGGLASNGQTGGQVPAGVTSGAALGATSIQPLVTMTGAAAADGFHYDPSTFNSVVDPIWKIGYNADAGVGSEPQWFIGLEGNYSTPTGSTGIWFQDAFAHNTNEWYVQYISPNGAVQFRPIYLGVLRDDNTTEAACVLFDIGTSGFPKSQFQIKGGTTTILDATTSSANFSVPPQYKGVNLLPVSLMEQNLVAPPGFTIGIVGNGATMTSLQPRGVRVVTRKAGTLHDISAVITVSSGNLAVAVYDTGEAQGGDIGERTLLYQSGSIACPAAGTTWTVLADPALTVAAGTTLDIVITADNVTAAFARLQYNEGTANAVQLPAAFMPTTGGALPKLWFNYPVISSLTAFTTNVLEAAITTQNNPIALIARVA